MWHRRTNSDLFSFLPAASCGVGQYDFSDGCGVQLYSCMERSKLRPFSFVVRYRSVRPETAEFEVIADPSSGHQQPDELVHASSADSRLCRQPAVIFIPLHEVSSCYGVKSSEVPVQRRRASADQNIQPGAGTYKQLVDQGDAYTQAIRCDQHFKVVRIGFGMP